jgi:hypothetical protein
MQVLIELNDDQADEVLVEALKSGYASKPKLSRREKLL